MQIGITSNTVSPLNLSQLAFFTIRPRLLHVPGVANVAMWGERKKEIQVQADPARMVPQKMSLNALMSAAGNAVDNGLLSFTTGSAIGTGGFIDTPNQRLGIRNPQVDHHASAIGGCPVARRGGRTLTVGDVARVVYDHPPLIGDAVVNGGPGLMLVVEKFPGANTLQVTKGIDRALAALAPGLPGIHIDTHIFRQAAFIHTAIHNLTFAVLLGCILVVFVLIAFLFQWRAAFVSLLAIPLSLAAAAIVLDAEGTTINTMILAGFGVAVGVVVDDAIIDMENIVRRLRAWRARGQPDDAAALLLAASLEVRTAILYATLINIVAVLPVVFVGGLTGAFFRPLAVAYALAVLASMLVALTVTPALAMVLMPSARLRRGRSARDALLQAGLRRAPGAGAAPAALGAGHRRRGRVAAVVVIPNLGQELFPTFKEPDLLMHFDSKPGTSLPEMRRMVTALQRRPARDPRRAAGRSAHRPGAARRGDRRSGVLRAVDHARSECRRRQGVERRPHGRRLLPGHLPRSHDVPARAHRRDHLQPSEDLVMRIRARLPRPAAALATGDKPARRERRTSSTCIPSPRATSPRSRRRSTRRWPRATA